MRGPDSYATMDSMSGEEIVDLGEWRRKKSETEKHVKGGLPTSPDGDLILRNPDFTLTMTAEEACQAAQKIIERLSSEGKLAEYEEQRGEFVQDSFEDASFAPNFVEVVEKNLAIQRRFAKSLENMDDLQGVVERFAKNELRSGPMALAHAEEFVRRFFQKEGE